jgi:Ca2+-binding RTX toxin-like protein
LSDSLELLEALEPRRLFAAAPVTINGTAGKDYITVATTTDLHVVVTVNGTPTDYPEGTPGFVILCGDGDDTLVVSPGTLGIYADGGLGNDKMVGGDGPDTFLGAAGKDQIYGGGGNDKLNGAGGNDKVLGEAGADRLYGGEGNDYIDGGSSGDRIYCGNGLDTALGQSGNDVIFAIDGVRDDVFGGSGTDIGYINPADEYGSLEQIATV